MQHPIGTRLRVISERIARPLHFGDICIVTGHIGHTENILSREDGTPVEHPTSVGGSWLCNPGYLWEILPPEPVADEKYVVCYEYNNGGLLIGSARDSFQSAHEHAHETLMSENVVRRHIIPLRSIYTVNSDGTFEDYRNQ